MAVPPAATAETISRSRAETTKGATTKPTSLGVAACAPNADAIATSFASAPSTRSIAIAAADADTGNEIRAVAHGRTATFPAAA